MHWSLRSIRPVQVQRLRSGRPPVGENAHVPIYLAMLSSEPGSMTLMDWDILKVKLDLIYLRSIRAAAVYGKPLGKILFFLHSVLFCCFVF